MTMRLYQAPAVVAFLRDAKERPEDDTPRLVLADWLEERGDPDRAEFIRLQCRLAPGASRPLPATGRGEAERRVRELLAAQGGSWLGPLWRHGGSWHRGLLALRLDRRGEPAEAAALLPWADAVRFEVTGRRALRRAVAVLGAGQFNHAGLDLRRPLGEESLLALLAEVAATPALRTLTLGGTWRAPRRPAAGPEVALSDSFFAGLAGLPLARQLTHVALSRDLSPGQAWHLRAAGIEPVRADGFHWMHALPPAAFWR